MSIDPNGIPIIGQQARVIIADHRIIAPNVVEVIDNGLGMGDSIVTLRISDPLKARNYNVPLVQAQVDELVRALSEHALRQYDKDKER